MIATPTRNESDRDPNWISPSRQAFLAEIRELSYGELTERKITIDAQLSDIRGQIERAALRAAETGVPTSPDWLRRAQAAARFKGWASQTIQIFIGQRKREESEQRRIAFDQGLAERQAAREIQQTVRASAFAGLFVQVAEDLLDPDTFEVLAAEARKRLATGVRHD